MHFNGQRLPPRPSDGVSFSPSPRRGCRQTESCCISHSADRAGASSCQGTTPSRLQTKSVLSQPPSSHQDPAASWSCRHLSAYQNTPSCCTSDRCWVLLRRRRNLQLKKEREYESFLTSPVISVLLLAWLDFLFAACCCCPRVSLTSAWWVSNSNSFFSFCMWSHPSLVPVLLLSSAPPAVCCLFQGNWQLGHRWWGCHTRRNQLLRCSHLRCKKQCSALYVLKKLDNFPLYRVKWMRTFRSKKSSITGFVTERLPVMLQKTAKLDIIKQILKTLVSPLLYTTTLWQYPVWDLMMLVISNSEENYEF